jgi:hypothetical protein
MRSVRACRSIGLRAVSVLPVAPRPRVLPGPLGRPGLLVLLASARRVPPDLPGRRGLLVPLVRRALPVPRPPRLRARAGGRSS